MVNSRAPRVGQRTRLTEWSRRPKTAQRPARRARMVLACSAEQFHPAVAPQLRITPATVGKWRPRFLAGGLEGLSDEPRPGAPGRIRAAKVVGLHRNPPGRAQVWCVEITGRRIRRGRFENARSLERAIREYLEEHNRNPKPSVWMATADEILENIQRSCERTSATGR